MAADGTVFAAWLTTGWDVLVSRSEDHGETWSKPVSTIGNLAWADHPWLVVAPNGRDLYVGYNKVSSYITTSHDAGETWSKPYRTSKPETGYYFNEGGVVTPGGTVVQVATAYGCCPYGKFSHKRPLPVVVIRSDDNGETWEQIEVDRVAPPPTCESDGCPKAQYGAQASIATDADGSLLLAYNGGEEPHRGEQLWVRTSEDGGLTWSDRQALSPGGNVIAAFPMATGTGGGDFRVAWADNRTSAPDQKRWNIWYTRSTDGGESWSEPLDISDGSGKPYQHHDGFEFFYGDYGDIGVTDSGATIVTWGEAGSYNGPGTTWYNLGGIQ